MSALKASQWPWTAAYVTALLLAVLVTVVAGAYFVQSEPAFITQNANIPFKFYGGADSTFQRHTHKLLLGMTIALSGLLLFSGRPCFQRRLVEAAASHAAFLNRIRIPLWSLPVLAPLVLVIRSTGRDQYLLGILLALALVLVCNRHSSGATRKLTEQLGAALCIFAFAYVLLPFWAKYSVGSYGELVAVEIHHLVTSGIAERALLGEPLMKDVFPYYGLMFPLLVGALAKLGLQTSYGVYVLLIRLSILVFFLISLLALHKHYRGRLSLIALALLLWLPWHDGNYLSIIAPNTSGIRFMGFALLGVCLALKPRDPGFGTSFSFGVCSGFAVLCNLETGICVSAGLLFYLLLRSATLKYQRLPVQLAGYAVGLGTVLACSLVAFLAVFQTLSAVNPAELIRFITLFGSGFGGLRFQFDPMFLLILLVSLYSVFRAIMLATNAAANALDCSLGAFGITIIIWMAYYANKPHAWNLWSYAFLFSFMIGKIFNPRRFVFSERVTLPRLAKIKVSASVVVFCLVVFPFSMNLVLSQVKSYRKALSANMHAEHNAKNFEDVSGISMPSECARVLCARADVLLSYSKEHDVYFVSQNQMTMMLLTRLPSRLPYYDIFAESFSKEMYLRNVSQLLARAPEYIFFESPGALLSSQAENWQSFAEDFSARISARYVLESRTQYWQVFHLRQ